MMIRHFIRIALRNIKRRKTLSVIQILCLSVGLAAFILVARYVQYEKDYDKFNANYERIYRLQSYKETDRLADTGQSVVPMANYLNQNVPAVELAIATNESWDEYLSPDNKHVYMEHFGIVAPSEIFSLFSFELIRGDKATALDDPNSIVLSETMAEKYFPGQDAMGKNLFDEQKKKLTVTGIMKDIPEQSSLSASYFRSNADLVKRQGSNWGNSSYEIYVLLRKNTDFEAVSAQISDVLQQHDPNSKHLAYLQPLSQLHLKETARDDRGAVIYFFSFIGILTLLLACVSFMNLTTSFSTMRSVEIGIRKVSGSNRNTIRLQFLTEAIVIALLAFVLAILIAYLILPVFNLVVNRSIQLQLVQNPLLILFLVTVVLASGFVGGSYPALILSSFKPVTVLKGKSPLKKGKLSGLNAMVYLQFILSVVLITSSIWMFKQVNFLKNKDLGFQKESLLHCALPGMKTNISYTQVRERILQNPGVEDMTLSINAPLHSTWGRDVSYEGGPVDDRTFVRWNAACDNFIPTMGMELVQGRNFSDDFAADGNSCLVNETAVQKFGWDNPIGKWIDNGEQQYTVIGVIKDFNNDDVHNPILPYFLLLRDEGFAGHNDLTFKVNPNTTASSLAHIRSVLRESFPGVLFEVNGYDADTNRLDLRIWGSAKNTFAFFTILAVFIAAIGLFGLVVFASQRRVKEIGIRKVQGAKAEQILPLVTRQFLILVFAANVIVYPLAKLMENVTPGQFKYQFTGFDLLIVLGISLLVTIVASGYQSLKASRINPVEALRYE
ncbi:ABC transporter permease [Mangrovibacterium diazotrophicum]|uniref:Putative ABC transport system permease protein n=1 Tax=Mangrovibacterium diazotrophicum TaxID=1261403 RepID=A0A419W9J0_9BACT|nr:ABC transporter permease [Mangrovibacterium diazotrophicum]RKD92072.1 putative ABC transport system permease protein [Mangrovibacterium diazotrophicum]